jgi:RNA polymerase sigma-70 factor (ECF subfamily)
VILARLSTRHPYDAHHLPITCNPSAYLPMNNLSEQSINDFGKAQRVLVAAFWHNGGLVSTSGFHQQAQSAMATQSGAQRKTVGGTGAPMGEPEAEPGQQSLHTHEFQTFYQENLTLIYRYVYSKIGNREEAEDLTSQIFLKAMRSADYERSPQAIQKWLFQVARTTIADYWRVYYRASVTSLQALLDTGWEGPVEEETLSTASSPGERVHAILQALPEHYREVLTCRFLLNFSIKETAQHMGLTEANVKVLQFRALKRAADIDVLASKSL